LVLLASLRGILTVYTDFLWFDDLGQTSVWSGILGAQIILSVVFVAIFFVLAWINLVIADRIAPALRPPGPEEELLVRWHDTVGRRNGLIRFVIAGFFALVAGAGAAAEWNEWILFNNPVNFDDVDPVFGSELSFYVFRLPFLTFVVNWFFAAFIIIGIITTIWHYINGGIRIQTIDRRTTPQVKAHISLILAILAGLKAAAAGAVLGAVIAEWTGGGGTRGLGQLMTNALFGFNVALTWLTILATAAFSVVAYAAIALVERVVVRWDADIGEAV